MIFSTSKTFKRTHAYCKILIFHLNVLSSVNGDTTTEYGPFITFPSHSFPKTNIMKICSNVNFY